MIKILKPCQREILEFPEDVRGDLADLLVRLESGENLSMPICRPMTTVGRRVYELRLRGKSSIYRVIFVILGADVIWLIHAFVKTSNKTPIKNLKTSMDRLKRII